MPPRRQRRCRRALIAMDPGTGFVRAMVGGRDFDESHFNRAVQAKRQPGSAFKPFVYAAALEAGYTPATVIQNLNAPIATLQGAWTPEDEHSAADSMSLRTALRTSSNRAAVRLLQQVGIPKTVEYAKTMGVGESAERAVAGARLGRRHAAIADRGVRRLRQSWRRTAAAAHSASRGSRRSRCSTTVGRRNDAGDQRDDGVPDDEHAGRRHQRRHGRARSRSLGFTLPAAGKTGTTNDFNDAWFVGFTPRLVAGVWVGFDQPHTILPNGFAADVAVPLWANFMKAATKGDKPRGFSPPPGQSPRRPSAVFRESSPPTAATTSTCWTSTATSNGARWSTPSTSRRGTEPSRLRSPSDRTASSARSRPGFADRSANAAACARRGAVGSAGGRCNDRHDPAPPPPPTEAPPRRSADSGRGCSASAKRANKDNKARQQ